MSIVTLQLRNFSNFVGSHFWNAQEESFSFAEEENKEPELEHDKLFRAGRNNKGEDTYTPRLILFDLKDSFGTYRMRNELYYDPTTIQQEIEIAQNKSWEGHVELHEDQKIEKNEYLRDLECNEEEEDPDVRHQQKEVKGAKGSAKNISQEEQERPVYHLDQKVKMWSDYLKLFFHPKTPVQIPFFWHGDDSFAPFDLYSQGCAAMATNCIEDALEENLRFFVEECDHLQSFQMLADVTDGFGGFSASISEYLEENYTKTPIITFGMSSSRAQEADSPEKLERQKKKRLLNTGLSLVKLAEYSSLYVPIKVPAKNSSPFLLFKRDLPYHTSAVIAAAIDAITSGNRKKKDPSPVSDLFLGLSKSESISGLSAMIPVPQRKEENANQKLAALANSWSMEIDFTPRCGRDLVNYKQYACLRSLIPNTVASREMLEAQIRSKFRGGIVRSMILEQPFSVPNSFPRILRKLDFSGFVNDRIDESNAKSVPCLARLRNSSGLHGMLTDLSARFRRTFALDPSLVKEYTTGVSGMAAEQSRWSSIELDDFKESYEKLSNLAEAYSSPDEDSEKIAADAAIDEEDD